ncbi:hypothetical protein AB1Y20_006465 [Prymnesium parvum]|uniref:Tudor domain-containing protein n=1 Tax=Prymnesium parvum TaxID=97485 RepID=A0AB34IXT4_PRYPA
MPKQLYGHKNPRSKIPSSTEDSSGWLTLMAGLPEDKRHAAIVRAAEEVSLCLPDGMRDSFAAMLAESAEARRVDCDEAWVALLIELCSDFGVPLGAEEEVEGADEAERAGAVELLAALRRHKVVSREPPPPPPLRQGDAVLAVLQEDGDWHEAIVESLKLPPSGGGAPRVAVRFVEWQKLQETMRHKVISMVEVADDEGAAESEGECEMCHRSMRLTFHHLVPKETHGRYLGKALPPGVSEAARAAGMEPQPSRELLNRYGAMLCRFCHSTVHRFAPNAVLAERFNTVEKLLAQPEIESFVRFASRQRIGKAGRTR